MLQGACTIGEGEDKDAGMEYGRQERPTVSANCIQVTPLGYFIHTSITTPIASTLKKYYI
jgi:hypothetical protein